MPFQHKRPFHNIYVIEWNQDVGMGMNDILSWSPFHDETSQHPPSFLFHLFVGFVANCKVPNKNEKAICILGNRNGIIGYEKANCTKT